MRLLPSLQLSSDTLTGCFVALGVAFLINLPLWHALVFTDEWQRPDVVIESSDEEFYLSRIREVADGYLWAGHPYLYERRDQRYPLGFLWEASLGVPMRWLRLDIKTVSILGDALFPFLLALILWIAVRPVLPEKRWRLLLIGILLLGTELYRWNRPVSPQATTILPLLWLWATLRPGTSSFKLTSIRSALIGLMTLSYPFHWTYCLAAEGLLTLLHLKHDAQWAFRIRRMMAIILPFTLTALPWIITMFAMRHEPAYAQTLERLGMIARHFPSGLPLQAIIVVIGVVTFFVRRTVADKTIPTTLLMLLAASLAVLNQPLLTGKEAEFSSHYRTIIIFPLWISVLWSAATYTKKWKRVILLLPILGLLVIAIQTISAVGTQWTAFETARTNVAERTQQNAVIDALNTLPNQQVILTDVVTANVLTVYTSHYPFFSQEQHMYLMPTRDVALRAVVQQALFPDFPLAPRSIVGSSYLNKALHGQTICRFFVALRRSAVLCNAMPDAFLGEEWQKFKTAHPTPEQMLQTLKQARVSYALMKEIPVWMRENGETVLRAGEFTLFRFEWI